MKNRRPIIYLFVGLALLTIAWFGGQIPTWATPAQSNGQQGISVPTATPRPSPQPVVLTVNLQRPNSPPPHASWAVPVHLALYPPGASGAASYEWDLSLDNSGRLAATLVLSAGRYDIRLKNLHTLRNVKRNVLLDGTSVIDMGTLREGDADGDNRVRASDFALLRAAYFTQAGDSAFDARADFDEDRRIRSSDFALLRGNYFATGDIEVAMARAAAAWPDGAVALALEPAALTVQSGEVFTVTLTAHAGDQPFVALDADMRFPPAALQLVGPNGQPATLIEPLGEMSELINTADNSAGRILYGAGVPYGASPLVGDVALARLHFRVLRSACSLSVKIVDGTVADPTGLFVTGPLSGTQVKAVPSNGHSVHLHSFDFALKVMRGETYAQTSADPRAHSIAVWGAPGGGVTVPHPAGAVFRPLSDNVAIAPSSKTVTVGDTFTLDVRIEGSDLVTASDVQITFDTAYLEVISLTLAACSMAIS